MNRNTSYSAVINATIVFQIIIICPRPYELRAKAARIEARAKEIFMVPVWEMGSLWHLMVPPPLYSPPTVRKHRCMEGFIKIYAIRYGGPMI